MKQRLVRKNGQPFGKMDILKHFFDEPEKEFHLRGIARLAKLAPSTASKYLDLLIKDRIITSKKEKGFFLFRANTQNSLYKDMKLLYNMFMLRRSGLIEYLTNRFNHPRSIILFGSFRKGENIKGSDIDIFIETSSKKDVDLSGFEKILEHPIQLFQFSTSEIEKMKTRNKELLNNIINGIALEGFFEVFK